MSDVRTYTGTANVRAFLVRETGPTLALVHRDEAGHPPDGVLGALRDAAPGTELVVLRIDIDDPKVQADLDGPSVFAGLSRSKDAGNVWLIGGGLVVSTIDLDLTLTPPLQQLLQQRPPLRADVTQRFTQWLERELRPVEAESLTFEMAFAEAARAIRAVFPPERAEKILRALQNPPRKSD